MSETEKTGILNRIPHHVKFIGLQGNVVDE
jgi:hypothetical protein